MKLILLAGKSNIIQLNLYFLRRFRLFSKKNRVLASSKLIIPQCSLLKCQYFPLKLFDAKTNYIDVGELDLHGIHRVIVGGESGPKARPMRPEWAMSVQRQCTQQHYSYPGAIREQNRLLMKIRGYMYILECADGSYYTGSTKDMERRLAQHQAGEGANHTRKRLPVKLVYFETFSRIDKAFYREKQVQGWSRKKKEALINSQFEELHRLAECRNETHYKNR